jgi:hypothetical protein
VGAFIGVPALIAALSLCEEFPAGAGWRRCSPDACRRRTMRDALGAPAAQKEPTRLPSRITAASARMELTIATMTMSR